MNLKNNIIKQRAEFITFYICSFFVYCFIGWIYEVITMYKLGFGFVNRGFLHGCYIPIYGFCAIFFIIILHGLVRKKICIGKINITPLIVFISVFILSSVIEYAASYILEKVFNLRLWSYNDYKYNLNGRIALASSCFFGIGGILIFYVIQPLLDKLRKKTKPEIIIISGIIIAVIMITDFIITVWK